MRIINSQNEREIKDAITRAARGVACAGEAFVSAAYNEERNDPDNRASFLDTAERDLSSAIQDAGKARDWIKELQAKAAGGECGQPLGRTTGAPAWTSPPSVSEVAQLRGEIASVRTIADNANNLIAKLTDVVDTLTKAVSGEAMQKATQKIKDAQTVRIAIPLPKGADIKHLHTLSQAVSEIADSALGEKGSILLTGHEPGAEALIMGDSKGVAWPKCPDQKQGGIYVPRFEGGDSGRGMYWEFIPDEEAK